MKKVGLFVLAGLILFVSSFAQITIENPKKPSSKNAGRVLKLKEIFRISDGSGDFYFTGIWDLKVAPSGAFFIFDKNQLLKFSAEGKFLENLLKQGNGPGEVAKSSYQYDMSYFINQDSIYIYDANAAKIIDTDFEGKMIDEIKLSKVGYMNFCGLMEDFFIFIDESPVNLQRNLSGFQNVEMTIILISKDGMTEKKVLVFPKEVFSGPRFGMDWAPFDSVADLQNHQIFVSHTCEYKIVQADIKQGRIIKSFWRKYSRVKAAPRKWPKEFIERYHPPQKKFEDDIQDLYLVKGNIWVKTSTKDKTKGYLIDVFSKDGQYLDNFFINVSGSIPVIQEDYLIAVESDESGNLQVVKYKIME